MMDETTDSQSRPPALENEAEMEDSYRLANPFEIGSVLRQLASRGDFLAVYFANGYRQLATRILQVDVPSRTFYFDWGGIETESRALLLSPRNIFVGVPEGIQVHFAVGQPIERELDGMPAFFSVFPEVLARMQRRDYFRVKTPILDPYRCRVRLPHEQYVRLDIHDISIGGAGLRSKLPVVAAVPSSVVLEKAELELRDQPPIQVDLEVCSTRTVLLSTGVEHHLGCRFLNLSRSAEVRLQKLITQLELSRKALA